MTTGHGFPALAQKSRQTCAPERPHPGFPGVGVLGPSALFGTGPSFTEVVSDTDDEGDDGEEGDEEGGKKKKKKSKKEKVHARMKDQIRYIGFRWRGALFHFVCCPFE